MTPASRRTGLLLAAAAVALGFVVAVVLALALPSTRDAVAVAGSGADPFAVPPARAVDRTRPGVAPARPDPRDDDFVRMRATAAPRTAASAADPHGGPRWVVRTFPADRYVGGPNGLRRMGKPQDCAQLGRLLDGRFGWVDATNTWRPVGISYVGAPISCWREDQQPQDLPELVLELTTLITDPARASAEPLTAVAWGMTGRPATTQLTVEGRPQPARASDLGVMLAVLPAGKRPPIVRAEVDLDGGSGRPLVVGISPLAAALRFDRRLTGRWDGLKRALVDERASSSIDYRTPDPDGGLPWGIAVTPHRDGGGWCRTDLGQIVGTRVGWVDEVLGTFADAEQRQDCIRVPHAVPPPSPARPIVVSFGNATENGGTFDGDVSTAARRGRVVRRTLNGRNAIVGVAHRDVVSVTVTTPRDVRTITPSHRSRVFAVVYDGDFPTGKLRVSARLRDGTVYRTVLPTFF